MVDTALFVVFTSIISTEPRTLVTFANVAVKDSSLTSSIEVTIKLASTLFSRNTPISVVSNITVSALATSNTLVNAFLVIISDSSTGLSAGGTAFFPDLTGGTRD